MHYISYNERKRRGTIDFPIELYHLDVLHPQYTMTYHWHIEVELLRVLEGELLVTLNEKEILLKKGDRLYISAGTLHGGIPTNCVYECIVFDMSMLLKQGDPSYSFLKNIIDGLIRIDNLIPNNNPLLTSTWDRLFDILAEKKQGYQLLILGNLYQLFGLFYQDNLYTTDSTIKSRDYKRVKQLKNVLYYIEQSYSSPLTLEQLSKIAGMSSKYFCQFFYEMTHKTPIDYLNNYRIERACYEMSTTDNTITEIAYNCGFNDVSYFIKTFKKYKSITPKQYSKLESIAHMK